MSGVTDSGYRDQPFGRTPAPATSQAGSSRTSGLWSRFTAWRAHRRATRFDRRAARRDWVDQVPPWAFGILHRGG